VEIHSTYTGKGSWSAPSTTSEKRERGGTEVAGGGCLYQKRRSKQKSGNVTEDLTAGARSEEVTESAAQITHKKRKNTKAKHSVTGMKKGRSQGANRTGESGEFEQ